MSATWRIWIRRISASLIVGFIVAIAVIGYQRTRRDTDGLGSVDPGDVGLDVADVAIGVYRGFQHTETVLGRPLFILNSIRTLSRASGWQEIEGVRLEFFRHGEPGPVLSADSASYNIETREARLQGGIHVEFPNGAFLNTDSGRFEAKRQLFVSEAPVIYVDGATFGQARRASYDLDRNRVELEGNAALRVSDGAMLVAPSMVYQRDDGKVIFEDGVELTQHLSRLRAPFGSVWLATSDGPPVKIDLSDGVELQTVVDKSGAVVEMWAQRVTSVRDPDGRWQLRARTDGPWIEVRFSGGENFFERTLRTSDLRALVGPDGILGMQASLGVCLREIPTEGPVRTAEGETARAWFEGGELTDVELEGGVEIDAEDLVARGTRVRLVQTKGLVMLEGDPSGRSRVAVDSARGELTCDQATVYDREGRVEARGRVQGQLIEVRLLGGSAAADSGSQPVRFAGEALEIADRGDRFTLRDNARIWQERRLLLADDIEYRHAAQAVAARGHVRATFAAIEIDPEASDDDDVVVESRELEYSALEHRAVFRGGVSYTDPKHTLTANRLSVVFDDQDEITDVEAEGSVEINDLELGRKLTGQRATRSVQDQTIVVTGSPAQLSDPRGNVASGESLTWNQADGTVSIGGGTELIYYPEEQP